MEIIWHGRSCFSLRGAKTTIVTDPFTPGDRYGPLPPLAAKLVLISHDHGDHNHHEAVSGGPQVIKAIGEYFVNDVKIIGYPTNHDYNQGAERGRNIVYLIEIDGFKLAHLGDLGEPLADDLATLLHGCDVLLVPVGEFYTINVADAVRAIEATRPKITVPMHYRQAGAGDTQLSYLDVFCREIGGCPEAIDKLEINLDRPDGSRVVILRLITD